MKKIFSIILSVFVIISLICSFVFIQNKFTQKQLNSNLIIKTSIFLSGSNNKLKLFASTNGNSDIKKSGFKKIIIQRKMKNEQLWENYLEYNNIYNCSNVYKISKVIVVESDYEYRVLCTHCVKKSLFSFEIAESVSDIVYF